MIPFYKLKYHNVKLWVNSSRAMEIECERKKNPLLSSSARKPPTDTLKINIPLLKRQSIPDAEGLLRSQKDNGNNCIAYGRSLGLSLKNARHPHLTMK